MDFKNSRCGGAIDVPAGAQSDRKPVRHLAGGAGTGDSSARAARRVPGIGLARHSDRLAGDPGDRHSGVADATRSRRPSLRIRLADRRLGGGLDHLLGGDAVQHADDHRRVRAVPPLADRPGHRGCAGPNHPVRLGVRGVAGRACRLRLSLGLCGADPDRPRHPGSRRHPSGGARQQRPGVLWRAGRSDHRAGRRDRVAVARALRGSRPHRGGARPRPALGADIPRQRQARVPRRLAARGGGVARLHRRSVPGRGLSWPLPAGCHRRDRLLCRAAHPAQVLAPLGGAGLRRRPAQRGGPDALPRRPWAVGAPGIARLAAVHRY